MVEFTALVFVLAVLMFFLLHMSFNLSENYDVLKVLLILSSMILGGILAHMGKLIAVDIGAGTALQDTLDITFWVWITLTSIVLIYFVIFFVVRAWNLLAPKGKEISLEDEENS